MRYRRQKEKKKKEGTKYCCVVKCHCIVINRKRSVFPWKVLFVSWQMVPERSSEACAVRRTGLLFPCFVAWFSCATTIRCQVNRDFSEIARKSTQEFHVAWGSSCCHFEGGLSSRPQDPQSAVDNLQVPNVIAIWFPVVVNEGSPNIQLPFF